MELLTIELISLIAVALGFFGASVSAGIGLFLWRQSKERDMLRARMGVPGYGERATS